MLLKIMVLASLTFASEMAGVSMPDEVLVDKKKLLLNGLGLRKATIFKVKVYVAGLYLEKKSSDPDAILNSSEVKKVSMRFVRDVKAKDIINAWNESVKQNCLEKCEGHVNSLHALNSAMEDMHEGESMSFTFSGDKIEVDVKNKKHLSLNGKSFSKLLLTTWLGEKPPNKELKDGMLGR